MSGPAQVTMREIVDMIFSIGTAIDEVRNLALLAETLAGEMCIEDNSLRTERDLVMAVNSGIGAIAERAANALDNMEAELRKTEGSEAS
ncbi:MAG: hypothetical protein WD767_14385 [Alphaproteobacteria bacterium]